MSQFGRFYRIMTFGQSHSAKVGCVIQGMPSNFNVCLQSIQRQLNRRRPGQSLLTTPRDQKDKVQCVSGLENGKTLGSPLCFLVSNQNIMKKDYSAFSNVPRPGHADYTYLKKYGIKAESGGGRSSARQTIGRVIAGALAKQFLLTQGIKFSSWVNTINTSEIPQARNSSFSKYKCKNIVQNKISNTEIERVGEVGLLQNGRILIPTLQEGIYEQFQKNEGFVGKIKMDVEKFRQLPISNLRCPDSKTAAQMFWKIKQAQEQNDSLGGIVQGAIYGLPIGLGQPCFDKFPALMAHAMMSLPATKGFQYGSGFNCFKMTGSQHNDKFNSDLSLKTNNSGGTLGGITTGETFNFKVAFKPVSSIAQPQETHDYNGKPVILQTKGRHDPCVLPRAPPIVDNMAAVVVMQLMLNHNAHRF